jgi:CheY-like chemotaxis protein
VASRLAKRVLVVEDRPDILELMLLSLEGAGFEVEAALNGREALEVQQRRAADVVITDIFMPEMDGIETIDRIRAEYPDTRIIAMSCGADDKQDYLKVARQIGADATLAKPFATADLLQLVWRLAREEPGAS